MNSNPALALFLFMAISFSNIPLMAQDPPPFHRHAVYLEIPYTENFPIGLAFKPEFKKPNFSKWSASYNYQYKRGGEVCVALEYNFRRPYLFDFYGPWYDRNDPSKTIIAENSRLYSFLILPEKRWLFFKKYQLQPWVGIVVPFVLSRATGSRTLITDPAGNTKTVSSPVSIISTGFGFNFGIRYSYKQYSVLTNVRVLHLPFQKTYSDIPGSAYHNKYTLSGGIMLGYSF